MNQLKQLIRYYNQNRKKIWRILVIIASVIILIQVVNAYTRRKNIKQVQDAVAQSQETTNIWNNTVNSSSSTNSVQRSSTSEKDTINDFINYCNNKELESAYNMLTDECKEQMFSNLEAFEKIYYNNAFENKSKESDIEKWSNNTYLVKLKESALSTGKTNDENQKGDYITVVKKDGNYKLNINSYVGYSNIEKQTDKDGLTAEVIGKNIYMNYEEYTVKFTNNSNENVLLDSLDYADGIYIEDTKGVKYSSYSHELSEALLTIEKGHTRELKIKFNSAYVSNRKIKTMVFSGINKNNKKSEFKIEL